MANPGMKADGTWAEPEELRCLFTEGGEEEEATPVSGGNFLFLGYASHSLTAAQEPASHLANEETEAQRRPGTCRPLVPRPRLNYGPLGSQPKSYPCTESLRGRSEAWVSRSPPQEG